MGCAGGKLYPEPRDHRNNMEDMPPHVPTMQPPMSPPPPRDSKERDHSINWTEIDLKDIIAEVISEQVEIPTKPSPPKPWTDTAYKTYMIKKYDYEAWENAVLLEARKRMLKSIRWTPKTHHLYPPFIRAQVRTLLLVFQLKPNSTQLHHPEIGLPPIPKDILYHIFNFLHTWNA